jgi:predicted permease
LSRGLRSFGHDLRQAARALQRRPLLFLVSSGVLALAIGASTAVFSVMDAVLLRPLPLREPDRLVIGWEREPESGTGFVEVSYPDYEDWRRQTRTLGSMAILSAVNSGWTFHGQNPLRVSARLVSGNFFDVMGAAPLLGRALTPADDRVGAERVGVVSHGLWQRAFGGDPGLVGRPLMVDGGQMTVVGVMPPDFGYPQGAELWVPLVPLIPEVVASRNVGWALVLGRLAEGATLAQARTEADAIVARLARTHQPTGEARAAVLTPFPEHFFGPARTALHVLLGAVLLVLLVACANVSALLLARASARQRETAVRLALGASRARLCRALLAESGLIALAGGVGGVLLAIWALDLLVALVPAEVPRLALAAVDGRVLAFAVGLSALSAVGAGLAPALLASRPSLTQALVEGARTSGPASHRRLRALLLATEAAVAVVLLSGAGLLVQTFQNLRTVELGYDPRGVLTAEISGPQETYARPAARRALYRTLVERLGALSCVV